jgi:hypothetical protein
MVQSPAAVWVDASGRMVEKLAGLQATTIIFSKAALHHYLRGFAVKKNLPCRLPYRPPGWTIAGVATSGMVEAATIGVVETNGTTTSGDGQEEVPPAATTTSGDGQEEVPATATIGVVVPAATTSGDGQEEVPAASGMVMTGVAGNRKFLKLCSCSCMLFTMIQFDELTLSCSMILIGGFFFLIFFLSRSMSKWNHDGWHQDGWEDDGWNNDGHDFGWKSDSFKS